jgi:hypothetical protein
MGRRLQPVVTNHDVPQVAMKLVARSETVEISEAIHTIISEA